MNKYSVVAIILAILSGITIGVSYTSNQAEKRIEKARHLYQQKLKHRSDSLISIIHIRDNDIIRLDKARKLDSIKVENIHHLIEQDELKTKQKRTEAKNFTNDEKLNWILSRYSH